MLSRSALFTRSLCNSGAFVTRRGYASGSNNILVVIEHDGKNIDHGSLVAVNAASKLNGNITALVAGETADEVANQVAKVAGISNVLVAKDAAYNKGLPENFAPLLLATQKAKNFTHIVASHSAFNKNILPRFAALLDVNPIADVTSIESADTFVRPIYAGNALATVESKDPTKIITVRSTAFPKAEQGSGNGQIETVSAAEKSDAVEWVGAELSKGDRPDLGSASKVVSGGRGLGSKENFEKVIYPLADALGAAVGASRAAVEAGYASNDLQIGQTGKIVAPELYVAVAISGAIQHLAGMKDSKNIVCINKDPEAPIFQVADFGLVADLNKAVPELVEKLKK